MSNSHGEALHSEPVFDLSLLSSRAANRVLQHMDQEAEDMYKLSTSLQKLGILAGRAIAVESYATQLAERAAQQSPQAARRLEEILDLTHAEICDVLRGSIRRY